jgi:internalin A
MLEVIRMIEEFTMSRWIAFCLLCLMIAAPLYAQDNTPTPYEIALQRIEAARERNATELDLAYLGLTELPPEIGQLSNLILLMANTNQLTNLPPEIGLLGNLQGLSLQGNQLTTLPPEIGQLSELQWLYLDTNRLATLPSEIGQLTQLQRLWLSDNHLTAFPSELWQLSNLQHLSIGDNELTALPSEIVQLNNLCMLDVRNNNLRHLPTTLGKLNTLIQGEWCGLYLDNNPLISPPPEVVEQGTAAVLDYLRNQAWYHTQRLLIGAAGGVGLFVLLMLGFRWKQRGGRKIKVKRG